MSARTVIIHNLQHACTALAAAERLAVPIRLHSAAGAGAYAGAPWFAAIIAAARAAHPAAQCEAVLDCGADVGAALAALRAGCDALVLRADKPLRRKIAAIAEARGARLVAPPRVALDLRQIRAAARDPAAELDRWLARKPT